MKQEPFDKGFTIHCHFPVVVACFRILVTKTNFPLFEAANTLIAYCYPVRVAPKVLQRPIGGFPGLFGIYNPVFGIELLFQAFGVKSLGNIKTAVLKQI